MHACSAFILFCIHAFSVIIVLEIKVKQSFFFSKFQVFFLNFNGNQWALMKNHRGST